MSKKDKESFSASHIRAYSDRLLPGMSQLRTIELESKERQKLGGHLFLGAADFVLFVATALVDNKPLFPDVQQDGDELLAQQARAEEWRVTRDRLRGLYQVAQDTFLYEQSQAIQKATTVVTQVKTEAELPYDVGLPRQERQQALKKATDVLVLRDERSAQQRERNLKLLAEASGEKLPRKGRKPDRKARRQALMTKLESRIAGPPDSQDPSGAT